MEGVKIIFWIAAGIVFYTYLGYGMLLWLLVKIKELFFPPGESGTDYEKAGNRTEKGNKDLPAVSMLIAAYNEEEVVKEKMENILESDYPQEKLKVVWITDGSTDKTTQMLNDYPGVMVLHNKERRGKTAAINRAMKFIGTPLVIFSDANAMVNPKAVREIVKFFNDPLTGCVAGEKRVHRPEGETLSSGGEGLYWRYESFLKRLDSRFYSAVGAAGELYAIRRELFEEMDSRILLDDFMLSMKIASRGYKIAYCPAAYAVESGSLNIAEERKRKVRISAGGIQSVIILRRLLNIFRYPLLSFQYISHRVLRWTITPLMLFLLLPLNAVIVTGEKSLFYSLIMLFQIMFYISGITGILLEKRGTAGKMMTIPGYFLFMNLNVVRGFFYLIKRRKSDGTWEKVKRNK